MIYTQIMKAEIWKKKILKIPTNTDHGEFGHNFMVLLVMFLMNIELYLKRAFHDSFQYTFKRFSCFQSFLNSLLSTDSSLEFKFD